MKFILIALCLSVTLFNQVHCNNVEVNQAELHGIKDAALKAFDILMAAVDVALTDATVALDAAVNTVNETVIEYEAKAHDVIDLAMVPINKMLNDSINLATSLGLNLTKCENYVDDLTDLPNNLLSGVVSCMTNQLVKAQSYADEALKNIKKMEQDMQKYASEISKCDGNILKELDCLANIVSKMSTDTIAVPAKIALDVTEEVALITALVPAVKLCFTEKVAEVPIKGAAIVAQFALCVGLPSNSTLL